MNFHKYLLLLGVGSLAVSAEPIERINVTGHALEKPLSQRIQASKIELSGDELNNRKADTLDQVISKVPTQFYLSLDNLTDVDARPHNSFLRHLSPMPGRSAAIGVRVQF